MRLKFNNMNELQRLVRKNGAVVKQDDPAPIVKPVPKPMPIPEVKQPEDNIALEGISLLRKQNENLTAALKLLTERINQQDKLIKELKEEEKSEHTEEKDEGYKSDIEKPSKYKFKINRNSDGLIESIDVNCKHEDEETEVTESKTLMAVMAALNK
jgi:hypothetical protein